MLQQVMTAPGVIEFHEVPMPKAGKGQVVVKIMKNWHLWIRYPCIPWKASFYQIPGYART